MSPNDIYRIIRTKADKINTVINAGEEAVELTNKNSAQILGKTKLWIAVSLVYV